jgi:hypothetical protein
MIMIGIIAGREQRCGRLVATDINHLYFLLCLAAALHSPPPPRPPTSRFLVWLHTHTRARARTHARTHARRHTDANEGEIYMPRSCK